MIEKTSIVIVTKDKTKINRWITSTCLSNIEMYTNKDEYEIILVDNEPLMENLDERYKYFTLAKHIINYPDIGYSASINQGVRASDRSTKYLCFMHPDVFIHEGWLPGLRKHLESGEYDAVYPSQAPMKREQVLKSYQEEGRGPDDAGIDFMTRDLFERMGGLDERFRTLYSEAALRNRLGLVTGRCNVKYTNSVIFTHINAGTLNQDWTESYKASTAEGAFLNEYRATPCPIIIKPFEY